LKLDTLVMIQTKFGFHWSSTFRGEDFILFVWFWFLIFGVLRPLSTIFHLYHGDQF
jgi:hypothetical protein